MNLSTLLLLTTRSTWTLIPAVFDLKATSCMWGYIMTNNKGSSSMPLCPHFLSIRLCNLYNPVNVDTNKQTNKYSTTPSVSPTVSCLHSACGWQPIRICGEQGRTLYLALTDLLWLFGRTLKNPPVAWRPVQQTGSDIRIRMESCFWPTDESKSNIPFCCFLCTLHNISRDTEMKKRGLCRSQTVRRCACEELPSRVMMSVRVGETLAEAVCLQSQSSLATPSVFIRTRMQGSFTISVLFCFTISFFGVYGHSRDVFKYSLSAKNPNSLFGCCGGLLTLVRKRWGKKTVPMLVFTSPETENSDWNSEDVHGESAVL